MCAIEFRQEGAFCVFPRDYSLGQGETVVVTVEYLPSQIGTHEARFIMLQVKCTLHFVDYADYVDCARLHPGRKNFTTRIHVNTWSIRQEKNKAFACNFRMGQHI